MDDASKKKKSLKEILFPLQPWWRNLLLKDWRDYMILVMGFLMIMSHYYDTLPYREVAENPCKYCTTCNGIPTIYANKESDTSWNLPLMNLSSGASNNSQS